MNFWFDPKNETKTGNDEGRRTSNTTSVESNKEMNNDKRGTEETESKAADISEEVLEMNTEDSERDVEQKNNEEDNKKKSGSTEKENDIVEQELQDEEDDGREITLSAAQHLALLRDTETALFIATLSHKKVSVLLSWGPIYIFKYPEFCWKDSAQVTTLQEYRPYPKMAAFKLFFCSYSK